MNKQINHEVLPWDSEFFGFPIGRLKIECIDDLQLAIGDAAKEGICLLYWAIPAGTEMALAAKSNVAEYVGDQVTLRKPINDLLQFKLPTGYGFQRHTQPLPDKEMLELSYQAGWSSRFKLDKNISDDDFHRLYDAWITNSCNGQIADAVFLACDADENKAGLITVAIKGDDATIGLLSVSPNHRRQGIAAALIAAAELFANQRHCHILRVSTQADNFEALSLYSKLGFTSELAQSFFHVWLDRDSRR